MRILSFLPKFSALHSTILSALLLMATTVAPSFANEAAYFRSVQGKWSGAGQIVAGKYKNTRFTCNFEGRKPTGVGMDISGTCRVGLFTQQLSAKITKRGNSYRGTFLDGAKGKGLDIVSGSLKANRLVVGINRKQLNGTMVARMKSKNQLQITISVRANSALVPVIGMTLKRTGAPS